MVGADDNNALLGPWANADLSKTARADAGIGADDGLPPEVRFVTNVAKLIRRRRAQPNSDKDPKRPAILLLQPTPPQLGPGKKTKRVPMLDNGHTPVNGRIWFVGAVAASGHYLDFGVTDDDDGLFQLITDVFGQDTTPAIVFDPRLPVPEARFYPHGLGKPDAYRTVTVADIEIGLDDVLGAVEKVYSSCLVTPESQAEAGKLWNNQDRWWPSSKAEAVVQLYLKAGLAAAFPTCTVRHEQHMPEGRLDLEIEQSDPLDRSKITRHAVLELKVLRSFNEKGGVVAGNYTLEWVESGVKQAAAYRNSKGAKWSALFCFDMRKENTGEKCFDHVRDLANGLSVILRRWYLYAKSKHYRDALASTT
jgi:hypothetical protein